MTEKQDVNVVKSKSAVGIIALTSRTFFIQIFALGATFLLTVFLQPAIFGIFYVVSAIISFLSYFSDIGLAAALIQKKEEITQDDLATTFTIQQILVVSISLIALILSHQIVNFYGLDAKGYWLFVSLVISFLISSLKTIPSVLLERKLEFAKLVIPQVLETVGFYGVAVILAWFRFGITSFTWAVLVRAIVGLIAIYVICPWRPTFKLSAPVARRLMKFGIPFQLNSFLALLKDDLFTVFLGKVLPFAQVGYIGWAKKWAEAPLRLIMDSVVRVTFPAFSRLQHDSNALREAIEKTLFGLSLTIFPITIAMLFFIHPFVNIIPKYAKWNPALFSFTLMAITAAVSSLSVPLTNTLNAVGKIKITLILMVMWTILTWVLNIILINLFGFNGVAISYLLIASTLIIVVRLSKQIVPYEFIKNVIHPFIGAIIQAVWYYLFLKIQFGGIPYLILIGLTGVILYTSYVYKLERIRITQIISVFRNIKHEKS